MILQPTIDTPLLTLSWSLKSNVLTNMRLKKSGVRGWWVGGGVWVCVFCPGKCTQIPENEVHCSGFVWKNYGMYASTSEQKFIFTKNLTDCDDRNSLMVSTTIKQSNISFFNKDILKQYNPGSRDKYWKHCDKISKWDQNGFIKNF